MKNSVQQTSPWGTYAPQAPGPNGNGIKLISREALKGKLDKKEDIKLVFALGEWHFRAMHIPGSLNPHTPEEALKVLGAEDEIVVYCSNPACPASIFAYYFLVNHGYKNVRRYAGGLMDWESAGYPLEGDMVAAQKSSRRR